MQRPAASRRAALPDPLLVGGRAPLASSRVGEFAIDHAGMNLDRLPSAPAATHIAAFVLALVVVAPLAR